MDVILYQVPSYDYLTTPNAVELQQSLYETDALLPLHKKQRHYQQALININCIKIKLSCKESKELKTQFKDNFEERS